MATPLNYQSTVDTGQIGGLSLSVPYQFTPTSGSLLVCLMGIEKTGVIDNPTGFTRHSSGTTPGASYIVVSKTSDGTETSLDFTTDQASRGTVYVLFEFAAGTVLATDASTYDDSSEETGNALAFTMGPITTGGANRTCIAAWFNDSLGALNGVAPVWSDSFVSLLSNELQSNTGHPALAVATREVAADTTLSTTLSYSETADQGLGVVITLIDPAGSGNSLAVESINQTQQVQPASVSETPLTKTVSDTLVDATGTLQDGLTGINWAFYDTTDFTALGTASASATDGVTDGFGVFSFDVTGTTLANAAQGTLVLWNNAGTMTAIHIVEVSIA